VNSRRELLLLLSAVTAPRMLLAQSKPAPEATEKLVRVGILVSTTEDQYRVNHRAFVDSMRELGWVPGRNVVYDFVYADNDEARLPALAEELVSRNPRVIHVGSDRQARAASSKTRSIPIVFASVTNAIEGGLIKSLARPGGNVTGVINIGPELGGKRLQLLKEALPKIVKVALLVYPLSGANLREQKLIEQTAATLGIRVVQLTAKEPGAMDAAFASARKGRAEAVLVAQHQVFHSFRKRILEAAANHHLPVVGARSEFTDDGALMSYGATLTEQIRRSAQFVDKILRGAKPADIPVEQPTRFELIVNMKTAKALGLTIHQPLLMRADRVIE